MRLLKDLWIAFKEIFLEYLKSRVFPITLLVIVLFFVLLNRLFTIQIKQGDQYSQNFEVRSEKTLPINSIRGKIYDCNGKLLAYNKISYTLTYGNDNALTEQAEKLDMSENVLKNRIIDNTINILQANGDDVDSTIKVIYRDGKYQYTVEDNVLLAFLKDVYEADTVDDLTEEQMESTPEETVMYLRKKFEIGNEYDEERAMDILACRYNLWMNRFQQYVPVEIAHDISSNSRATISENRDKLIGMDVIVDSSRVYNDAKYFSHIIGYVGKASQDDIDRLNEESKGNMYDNSDVVGKTGIEQAYELELHGSDGEQTLYVDNLGKVLEVTNEKPAAAGNDVYLSIDSDLQKYCYDMLEKSVASILISKIVDMRSVNSKDREHLVPITDVYAAFFINNQIKLSRMTRDDATDLEKSVYSNFTTTRESTLETMNGLLTDNPVELRNLSDDYQDYCEYVCEFLANEGIYDSTKVNHEGKEFLAYINDEVSLQHFLKHLISVGAIDVTSIEKEGKYYDSDEMYDLLVEYITEDLKDDDDFNGRIIRNMIRQGSISGNDCINLLYDQQVLNANGDVEYQSFKAGGLSSYGFVIAKLKSLEITPAMLALTPCSGAIVVTDVNTGEIRALVSYPSYDNNYLTNTVDPDYYQTLLEDKTDPLYNRACMMRTAPGSTFKPISAVAGVSEGVLDQDEYITDLGQFDKVYTKPMCWAYRDSRVTHGSIGLSTALDISCNYFFFEVGYRLATRTGAYVDDAGLASLRKYASEFGLDGKSGIEIDEISPHISDRDAVTSAIGQGTHAYAPVQMSKYATTLANGGTCYNLSLLNKITDYDGNTIMTSTHSIDNQVSIDPGLWDKIHTGMRLVVTDDLAKQKLLNSVNVEIAGKTGTAQEGEDRPAHALFISYAPYTAPEYSVTTVIPNGYSSGNAAELTAFVYAYLYDKEALTDATFANDTEDVGD